MNYVAGIDIGSTSISIVILSKGTGELIKVVEKANNATLKSSSPWEKIQDPKAIIRIIQSLIEECSTEWRNVLGVGISCQMHGIVYVDKNGSPISPLFSWQDGRGDLDCSRKKTYAEVLSEFCSIKQNSGYGMVTHFYNFLNDLVPEEAEKLCTIGDCVAMWLCNQKEPIIDSSNAASLGMFSVEENCFDMESMKLAGLECSILPRVAKNSKRLGFTPDGKVVFCAIGDNQASFLGSVPQISETLLINIGTGSQISTYINDFLEVDGVETRPFPLGGYLLVGASLGGGKSYAMLAELISQTCKEFGLSLSKTEIFEKMNSLVEEEIARGVKLPQSDNRFFGTRENPKCRGSITGISQDNLTIGCISAGFLSGILEELLEMFGRIPEKLVDSKMIISGAGNGIRKNVAMKKILAKKLEKPIYISEVSEEAALGAAIYACICLEGFRSSEKIIRKMKKGGFIYEK